jgi:glycerol uptake facilitator-like aquaporin
MISHNLPRKLAAEFLGTAFLLATVIGSGIMGETLSGGNIAIALLGNTIATGAVLAVLILVFGPISGAHFNPAVTLAFVIRREISIPTASIYVVVQIIAALFGVFVAHVMFGEPSFSASQNARTGIGIWTGEFVATFGLLATILSCLRFRPEAIPYAVGLFITAGYWFTSSTSFANPAVTIARSFSDSFAGIRPEDAPVFILVQIIAAIIATLVFSWFALGDSKTDED